MSAARQRGVALLVALLALALAALLAAAMLERGEFNRAQLRDALRAEQAQQLMLGLEDWAADALAITVAPRPDTLDAPWLAPMPPIEVPGARIEGRLHDLGGCFDLNRLVVDGRADPAAIAGFERMLVALQLDPRIASEAADWIDADQEALPAGAEDAVYLAMTPPGRTADRPIAHASEIRRLRSVDAPAWQRLSGLVCALPRPQPLNLNTAPPLLWMSLDPRIDEAAARRLARTPGSAYASREAVVGALAREGIEGVELGHTALVTGYYLAEGRIRADGIDFVFSSLIERDREARAVRVVGRARGRL